MEEAHEPRLQAKQTTRRLPEINDFKLKLNIQSVTEEVSSEPQPHYLYFTKSQLLSTVHESTVFAASDLFLCLIFGG